MEKTPYLCTQKSKQMKCMKKTVFAITLLIAGGFSSVKAEGNTTTANSNTGSVRYVKAPRFARPLVEKWISEYAKTQPGTEFQIAKGNQQVTVDLNVVLDSKENNNHDFSPIIFFGETAVLPITARSSEAARLLEGKHLNQKKLKQLYFLNDDLEEDTKKLKQFEQIIVYSGSNRASAAASFAQNLGDESSNFRGKRISGDDLFLNTALTKDPLGVSFNTLPNIFDLQSRHVKSELSIIGLDLKKDLEAHFSDEASLDDVLQLLENGRIPEVAVEKVGLTYNVADDAVVQFLHWILTNGTKYNHEFGLQNLDHKEASIETEKVRTVFTAQK